MFDKGLAIARIAEERRLAESTIQGHLCFFIEKGTLDINRLLSPEKQEAIEAALAIVSNNSLKAVKEELGDDNCSYGEIKWMVTHLKCLASK
jgi:uncharacterized protein YpbB